MEEKEEKKRVLRKMGIFLAHLSLSHAAPFTVGAQNEPA
jgi:hypothetical protein